MVNSQTYSLIRIKTVDITTNYTSSSSSSKYSASFNLKIIALERVMIRSVLFTGEYVTTGTVYGVNLISVISLVNCFRVRDPTTVAGKVFQSLVTVGEV